VICVEDKDTLERRLEENWLTPAFKPTILSFNGCLVTGTFFRVVTSSFLVTLDGLSATTSSAFRLITGNSSSSEMCSFFIFRCISKHQSIENKVTHLIGNCLALLGGNVLFLDLKDINNSKINTKYKHTSMSFMDAKVFGCFNIEGRALLGVSFNIKCR
jgi:hypothetical protein